MRSNSRNGPHLEDVLDAAFRLLAYRPRSEAEVRRRLSRRFSAPLVEDALTRLKERELLDDAAFAKFWRDTREQCKPKGAAALRWELLRLGISRDVVAETLEGLDEEENAYRAAGAILRRLQGMDYAGFKKKVVPYLRRRGFGLQVANRAAERLWGELPNTADGGIEGQRHRE